MNYKYYVDKIVPKIDEIVDNFDFERVKDTMDALNWGWATTRGEVPEISDMKALVRSLFKDLFYHESTQVATGGFVANRDDDDNLELSFVVANWYTEPEEN